MKTTELTGKALDLAVAMAEGGHGLCYDTVATWWITIDGNDRAIGKGWAQSFAPSTDWAHGGPIIDRIDGFHLKRWLESRPETKCQAHINNLDGDWVGFGPTSLIAAMRCYVASKLGDEIDIPKELLA